MPTYEYICRACGHEFEEFQSIKADPIAVCPKCRKRKVERKIGVGGAVIFKGGGFYETDYRSDSYRSGEEAEKKAGEPANDSGGGKVDPQAQADASRGPAGNASPPSRPDAKAGKRADMKPDTKPDTKPGMQPAPRDGAKSDAKQSSSADATAAAAENRRIAERATHRSRIGRGIGNVVAKAAPTAPPTKSVKSSKPGKPAQPAKKSPRK